MTVTQYTWADLELADRHIVEGRQLIARQEEILSSLRMHGLPCSEAEKLLVLFNDTHAEHQKHRDAIAAAIAGESEPWN